MPKDNVGPSPSFLEKLRGKRTGDIHLPTPKGARVDPRLAKKKKTGLEQMQESKGAFDLFVNRARKNQK